MVIDQNGGSTKFKILMPVHAQHEKTAQQPPSPPTTILIMYTFSKHYQGYAEDILILYEPASALIFYNWDCKMQVLHYLYHHHEDCDALQAKARQRSPNHQTMFCIQHVRATLP